MLVVVVDHWHWLPLVGSSCCGSLALAAGSLGVVVVGFCAVVSYLVVLLVDVLLWSLCVEVESQCYTGLLRPDATGLLESLAGPHILTVQSSEVDATMPW